MLDLSVNDYSQVNAYQYNMGIFIVSVLIQVKFEPNFQQHCSFIIVLLCVNIVAYD